MQRLFNLPKISMFLDRYSPGEEERRGDTTKIINLTLRVEPFDSQLAVAIDDGLGEDRNVRGQLFQLTTGDPKWRLERVQIQLDCPRQTLHVFAAPDIADARIVLPQVKILSTSVKALKEGAGFALIVKAAYGPVAGHDLEFLHQWYTNTQFVTFEEAEPSIEFDLEDDNDDEGPASRPPFEWGDDAEGRRIAIEAALDASGHALAEALGKDLDIVADGLDAIPMPKRKKKTGRHSPEAERAVQMDEARGKSHPAPNGAAHE